MNTLCVVIQERYELGDKSRLLHYLNLFSMALIPSPEINAISSIVVGPQTPFEVGGVVWVIDKNVEKRQRI